MTTLSEGPHEAMHRAVHAAIEEVCGGYTAPDTWRADDTPANIVLQAALAAASEAGWELVPREATKEMLGAFDPYNGAARGPYGDERYYLREGQMRALWAAMIKAVVKYGHE